MPDPSGQPPLDSTHKLVLAAQGGDKGALDELFDRYLPRTRRIVACRMGWRLKQLEDLEDIVQTALMKAFQGLERFEPRSEGSFRHWLAQCVENTIRNTLRDAQRLKRGGGGVRRWSELRDDSLSVLTFAGEDPSPSARIQQQELEDRLETALLSLSDRYRQVVVLRSFCGMSYAEIKDEIGVAEEATVRQIYSRALAKLRELLER
ncbi:MAG TPA: sigma-70 family RNA polymerase sigma factor [Planctomycetota bacterium]|nr:sigma-70 family RNA polymerase sigma factor [Planctomycetota bacterium]